MSPSIRPHSVPSADRWLSRAVFLLALAVYTATFVGLPDNPDAEVEFQTTRALYQDHSLALSGTPEAELIVAHRFDVREGAGERQGRFYSWFGVGQAFVALPFFAVGRLLAQIAPRIQALHEQATHYGVPRSEYFEHLAVGWRNPLLGALTAGLIVVAARRLGTSRPSAFVAGLGYALCTYAWPQARSTLSDVQATFLLFLAFDLLLSFREADVRGTRPRLAQLALFGLALGLAFLTRLVTAPAVAVLVALLCVVVGCGVRDPHARGRRLLELGVAGLPAALCAVLFLVLNERRFGDPFESGYGAAVTGSFFSYPLPLGLAGLLVAPGRGLLWFAPAVVLAAFGLARALRAGERLFVLGAVVLGLALTVPYAMTEDWHGAWTFGPRYVLPFLPVLWVFVAQGMDAIGKRRSGRYAIAALLGLGFVTNLSGVLVDATTHLDLGMQAQRLEWPDPPGETEAQDENLRFARLQWDWRYAAPWAHWRILRHRLAGLGEEFPVRELYFLERDERLRPTHLAGEGFRHLAWVDHAGRLGGSLWPPLLGVALLLLGGVASAVRGFDPALAGAQASGRVAR